MRAALYVALAALAVGAGLVGWSVVRGMANVSLWVVVPVVSGSSAGFLGGVLLLVVGFFALPFAIASGGTWSEPSPGEGVPVPPAPREGGWGGFVLVGPVPVVFGSWRNVSRATRWVLAFVGAALFTALIVAFVVLAR